MGRKRSENQQKVTEPSVPRDIFAEIPQIIHESGRVKGFERLRDILLERWVDLGGQMNPYSALKIALETDRHALFSEIAEEKTKTRFDQDKWSDFQKYLHGEVDAPMGLPTNEGPSTRPIPSEDQENEDVG